MSAQATDDGLRERVQGAVDRMIQRNIKGLQFMTSPEPEVGLTPSRELRELEQQIIDEVPPHVARLSRHP